MLEDLTRIANTVGFGHALLLAILLWTKKTPLQQSNRYLAISLFAFSIILANTIIRLSEYVTSLGWFEQISNTSILLIAPSIFLYVSSRLGIKTEISTIWHYLPFIIYAVFNGLHLVLQLSGQNIKIIVDHLAFLAFQLQFGIYLSKSFKIIGNYKEKAKNEFSSIQHLSIIWMKRILRILHSTWLIALTFVIYEIVIGKLPDLITLNLSLTLLLVVGILGIRSYLNPEIFSLSTTYENTKISSDQSQSIIQVLNKMMAEKELFLDQKLTVHQLSEVTGVSRRQISQVLNQKMGSNFFDYVNRYRAQYFKEKLENGQHEHLTMQALSEESGFRSISTAYAAFKKHTGTTPAKYRKKLQSEIE